MEFWASCEVSSSAYPAMVMVHREVEPFLNISFASSSLSKIDATLRYVPIIMPEKDRERYPARSKLRKKARIYDCAPQLDYNVFINGSFEDQLREYLRGIAESAPYLVGLGATLEQTKDFEKIVSTAGDYIISQRSG